MRNDAFHRSASCHIADLRVKEGVQGNTSHGRQDKSADPGLAHVVGWVDVFSHFVQQRCRRSGPKCQANQRRQRRRLPPANRKKT
jgi:hypothetical protein